MFRLITNNQSVSLIPRFSNDELGMRLNYHHLSLEPPTSPLTGEKWKKLKEEQHISFSSSFSTSSN